MAQRASTHNYPQEEINAMKAFYNGKRCPVTLDKSEVQWARILDAALDPSNEQLEWMLRRKLRQDRYPTHAAEVRENVIPLNGGLHRAIDLGPPRATLFLHEDVLARTLAFERDLQDWRESEVRAGRGDPGRPEYEDIFLHRGTQPTTPHRWHAGLYSVTFVRHDPEQAVLFTKEQCPGIDPPHEKPFPVFDTLLSIPFSLLYNVPRLAGICYGSLYRRDLVAMALEIIYLWHWDPEPSSTWPSNITLQRDPRPPGIHHHSRNTSTFANMRLPRRLPIASPSSGVTQADSGAYIIGFSPHVQFQDGTLKITPPPVLDIDDEGDKGCQTLQIAPTCSLDRTSSASYVSWLVEAMPSDAENTFDDTSYSALETVSLKARVVEWLEDLDKGVMDPLPADVNDTAPFTPGDIGGMSANDALMVRGLIKPHDHFNRLLNGAQIERPVEITTAPAGRAVSAHPNLGTGVGVRPTDLHMMNLLNGQVRNTRQLIELGEATGRKLVAVKGDELPIFTSNAV